jgi:hypothetical protein
MASALQCPSCGTKTQLDSQAAGETFSCERCGQVLKVPARRGASGGGRAGASPKAPNPGGGAPPAPRRRARPVMTAGGGVATGGTAVLAAPPIPTPAGGGAGMGGPVLERSRGRGSDSAGARPQLALPLRIGAWLIAVPLGLVIVGLPARKLGFLSSQKLLDVIVKRDIGRFVPLLIIIALWAFVSAVLVTAIVEIARRRRARRVSRRADGGSRGSSGRDGLGGLGAVGASAPSGAPAPSAGPTPPPRRRGGRPA